MSNETSTISDGSNTIFTSSTARLEWSDELWKMCGLTAVWRQIDISLCECESLFALWGGRYSGRPLTTLQIWTTSGQNSPTYSGLKLSVFGMFGFFDFGVLVTPTALEFGCTNLDHFVLPGRGVVHLHCVKNRHLNLLPVIVLPIVENCDKKNCCAFLQYFLHTSSDRVIGWLWVSIFSPPPRLSVVPPVALAFGG